MFMIRSGELLADGRAEEAVAFAMEGTDRDQRIDTTTSSSDLYAFLIALPALSVADADEARKVGNAVDRVTRNDEARLSNAGRASIGCGVAAWQGNARVAIPRCRDVLMNGAGPATCSGAYRISSTRSGTTRHGKHSWTRCAPTGRPCVSS